jgi:hypothetical protein
MNGYGSNREGAGSVARGVIRRRLLVNAVVDPDEAARRLPPGVRPHVTTAGTVVGCCLLDIGALRPGPVPAIAGIGIRAGAHRISAEWEDARGETEVGVFVPHRLTSSRLTTWLGGRVFPGAHHRADVAVDRDGDHLHWRVCEQGAATPVLMDAHATVVGAPVHAFEADEIGATCLRAEVGISARHDGVLEGVRMEVGHDLARPVRVDALTSSFVSTFTSARPAPSYLVEDAPVAWHVASAPVAAVVDVA